MQERDHDPGKYKKSSEKLINNSTVTPSQVECYIPQGNATTLKEAGSLTPLPNLFRR